MPNHEVIMKKVPPLKIGKSDLVFDIKLGKDKLGTVGVSRGLIVWTPANNEYSYSLPWEAFGDMAVEKGKRHKVTY